MTTTSMTNLTHDSSAAKPAGASWRWGWALVIGFLFITLFATFLERTLRIALGDPKLPEDLGNWMDYSQLERWGLMLRYGLPNKWSADWSHILIVPFVSLYYLHLKREDIKRTPKRVFWPALLLTLVGILIYAAGVYPIRNDMIQGYALILSLLGLSVFIVGPRMLVHLLFPLGFLMFGVKVSDRFWDQIAFQMQQIAASASGFVLQALALVLPFSVQIEGNKLGLTPNNAADINWLNIAEACAGLRMLMAFMALGVAMAFLTVRPWWQRILICIATVPVAIVVNVGRVTVLGLFAGLGYPELAKGDVHTFIGILMLIPAAGLFWLLGWIMNNLFIGDEQETLATKQAKRRAKLPVLPSRLSRPRVPDVLRGLAVGTALGLGLLGMYVSVQLYFRPDMAADVAPALSSGAAWIAVGRGLPRVNRGRLLVRYPHASDRRTSSADVGAGDCCGAACDRRVSARLGPSIDAGGLDQRCRAAPPTLGKPPDFHRGLGAGPTDATGQRRDRRTTGYALLHHRDLRRLQLARG